MKEVKGKLYRPMDNSHIKRLDNNTNGMLSGVCCEIISEPYVKTIKEVGIEPYIVMMVDVRSKLTDIEYSVLWYEEWVIDDSN